MIRGIGGFKTDVWSIRFPVLPAADKRRMKCRFLRVFLLVWLAVEIFMRDESLRNRGIFFETGIDQGCLRSVCSPDFGLGVKTAAGPF
ncbi:MAG: hypothetical protein K0S39_1721 [Paenibacillus sp.]|nr:hypothetical protein [Paenibacillus sp.]